MNHALALLIVALCTPCTAAFQVHPKTSLRLQPSAGACAARRTVTASLFGNKQKEEAEERARIEAEQEALNARYARESQNDLIAMSVFGVFTTLPVLYLLLIAFSDEGGGGAGVY